MDRKINLFTLMIFAYSVVVCSVCKKDAVNESTSGNFKTSEMNVQPRIEPTIKSGATLSSLTASADMKAHLGQ